MEPLSTVCEQKKPFLVDDKRIEKWVKMEVAKIIDESKPVRCAHCYGKVRIHRQRKESGTQDHVEHYKRSDSENCIAGHYYKGGGHKMSSKPVI